MFIGNKTTGMTLVELLIAIGISGVLMMAIMSMQQISLKQQNQSNITFQADSARRVMMSDLNSGEGWSSTLGVAANNPNGDPTLNMTCLSQGTHNCQDGNAHPFFIVDDGTGTKAYDFSGNKGLSSQGVSCGGFVPTGSTGNDNCPLQYTMTWTAICSSYPCTPSTFQNSKIALQAVYNPQHWLAFNAGNYSAIFMQGSTAPDCTWTTVGSSIVESCANIGVGTTTPNGVVDVATTNAGGRNIILRAPNNQLYFQDNAPNAGEIPGLKWNMANGQYNLQLLNAAPENDIVSSTISTPISIATNTNSPYFGAVTLSTGPANVGIGNMTPQYKLDVAGDVRANTVVYNSDMRLKDAIRPLSSALDAILSLKGVSFRWNKEASERGIRGQGRQIGLLAQDVEKAFPMAVRSDSEGFKAVNYPVLIAPVIEAIRQLHDRWSGKLENQEKEIAELKKHSEELEADNSQLREWICHQGGNAPFCGHAAGRK